MQNRLSYVLYKLPQKMGQPFHHVILLALRLYIASVFLRAGVQKLSNWDSTVFLFEYEYSVPLLSPTLAAVVGTAAEIILPVLLIIGLFTRWTAISLFVFNIVAVASYSALTKGTWGLTTVFGFLPTGIVFPTKGYEDHVVWGLMILVTIVFGAGKISADARFMKK